MYLLHPVVQIISGKRYNSMNVRENFIRIVYHLVRIDNLNVLGHICIILNFHKVLDLNLCKTSPGGAVVEKSRKQA